MEEHTTGDADRNHPRIRTRPSNPATVLLVDDDEEFRDTERFWLADDRHWVTREASNGEEALAKLDETIDVLVLDQRMPLLSGPEVVARLNETEFVGDVVLVSADPPDGVLTESGIAAYLRKPIDRREFVETVTQYAP